MERENGQRKALLSLGCHKKEAYKKNDVLRKTLLSFRCHKNAPN